MWTETGTLGGEPVTNTVGTPALGGENGMDPVTLDPVTVDPDVAGGGGGVAGGDPDPGPPFFLRLVPPMAAKAVALAAMCVRICSSSCRTCR